MHVNADYAIRVVLRPEDRQWIASPAGGVERVMLDRIGDEVARATSLVRYAPGSAFPEHVHGGGEEILVLEGVFADEHGEYPAGSYLRNPAGTRHRARSDAGCLLFVKLWQFLPGDDEQKVVSTRDGAWSPGLVDGLSVMPLHQYGTEGVAMVRWAPGTTFHRHQHWSGEEILVLDGVFQDEHGAYPAGSWLRSPHGSQHTPFSDTGCLIYVKTGHLPPGP